LRPDLPAKTQPRGQHAAGRFRRALAEERSGGFPLICEVKRASPSAGVLRSGADAAELSRTYAAAGARCLSILTEERRFGGSLQDLRAARSAVAVPLLRKDFIVDPYMVYEAAEWGADCVLLIAAAVDPSALMELAAAAEGLGLDTLLEVIYPRDLEVLALRDWPMVGINARDLETLELDAGRLEALAPAVRKPGRLIVAESGIQTRADIDRIKKHGAAAALIGEALMRSADPASLIRELGGLEGVVA
jgi:indole-3-glycerol phosphate synthase